MANQKLKVALVCDFLTKIGGAQKTLLALAEIYPNAPVYCLLYDKKGPKGLFSDRTVIPTSLQKLPDFIRKNPKLLVGRYAKAIEEFDLSNFDVVISSNDSFAHGVVTKPSTFHLCYCHTPTRYLWDWHNEYLKENGLGFGPKGMLVRYLLHKQRIWDRVSADRVDQWIANSENVKKRIKKYYQSDSEVIYPPVEVDDIEASGQDPDDFYIVAARLEPYKRVDLAIRACNKLGKKLLIIGEGSQREYLESIAGPTIKFLGWQPDDKLRNYMTRSRAFIFAGEDDFGITPVESMAAGRPVIAYGAGGALETVVDGKTGLFFKDQTVTSLIDGIESLEREYKNFKPDNCRAHAEKFSTEIFQQSIKNAVESGYKKHIESLEK